MTAFLAARGSADHCSVFLFGAKRHGAVCVTDNLFVQAGQTSFPPDCILFFAGTSVLPVPFCFIPVCPEQKTGNPGRGPGHDLADGFDVCFSRCFDDHLVMDMADDAVIAEVLHGIGEDIAGDGLDDVFDNLGTEGFNPVPFFAGRHAFIGNGYAAESVDRDFRLRIGEAAAPVSSSRIAASSFIWLMVFLLVPVLIFKLPGQVPGNHADGDQQVDQVLAAGFCLGRIGHEENLLSPVM